MTTLLDHALDYARRGWPVFPVRRNKRPYTQHGFQDATTDAGQITSWWKTWPTAGIGIATGARAGIWVLDIDTRKGGTVSLDALLMQHGPIETLTARTGGGGQHLYFRWPARAVRNRTDIEPGIDARGEGGYVVAPPSGHESGDVYSWQNEAEIADAPEWLLDLVAPLERAPAPVAEREPIKNPRAYGDAALRRAAEDVGGAVEGTRNHTLNAVVHSLSKLVREGCLTRSRVESGMQLAAERAGLTADETRKTIASALGDAREPADMPPGVEAEAGETAAPLVLPNADPTTLAEAFLATMRDARGRMLLRRWRSSWWRYDSGAYSELSDEEAEAPIWRWLAKAWCSSGGDDPKPKRVGTSISKVANVARALTSIGTYVDSAATPPVWIDGEHDAAPRDVAVCANGVLDLATGALTEHTPDLFATGTLGVSWDASAPKPRRWLTFLGQLFGDDHQAVRLLQEWFGYCLGTDTSQQKMLFLVGPKRSGKGTIARILTALVGRERIAAPTLSGLAGPFGLQPLLQRPVAIIADARLRGHRDEGPVLERMLSITGEDWITIDRKNRESITVRLPTRLALLSNELPRLSDASAALASRMLVLELRRSFYGHEDTDLEGRLLEELPGILSWAVDGWRALVERGRFVEPDSSQDAKDELEAIASPVRAFVDERCRLGPDEWIERGTLYEHWVSWAKTQGLDPSSSQLFGRNLRASVPGIVTTRPRVGDASRRVVYRGINVEAG